MSTVLEPVKGSASHQLARERFSRKSLADKYPCEYSDRWRDRRERACIEMCLESMGAAAECSTCRVERVA